MPTCHFHRGVETNVSCPSCGRFMCPKDMVATPVGYKCRECAAPPSFLKVRGRPIQYAGAIAASAFAGIAGGLLLGQLFDVVRIGSLFLVLAFGVAVGEVTRRGGRGHRGIPFAVIACLGAIAGSILGGFHFIETGFAAGAAVLYLLYGI